MAEAYGIVKLSWVHLKGESETEGIQCAVTGPERSKKPATGVKLAPKELFLTKALHTGENRADPRQRN